MLAPPGWPNFSLWYWLYGQIWLVPILVASLSLFTIRLAMLCALDVNAHLFLAADIPLRRPPSRRYGTEECCVDGLLWVGNLRGAKALSWCLRFKEIACAIDDRPVSRFTQTLALPQTLPARHRTRRSSKLYILCRRSVWLSWLISYPVPSVCRGNHRGHGNLERDKQYAQGCEWLWFFVTICSDARFSWSLCYKYPQQNRRAISHNS